LYTLLLTHTPSELDIGYAKTDHTMGK